MVIKCSKCKVSIDVSTPTFRAITAHQEVEGQEEGQTKFYLNTKVRRFYLKEKKFNLIFKAFFSQLS